MKRRYTALAALCAAVLVLLSMTASAQAGPRFRVLVFSKVTNFYHDSIPAGVEAIKKLGAKHGFEVEATTEGSAFTDANLARFDVLVFNNTNSKPPETGNLLNEKERKAFQNFIRKGGGWAGLHAATASERDWDWYEGLVGTIFENHPNFGKAGVAPGRIKVLDRAHPSTKELPELWERKEEWYNWRVNPTGKVHTLAQIKLRDGKDGKGIGGLNEGVDHPYSWCQNYDGGRSWYTAGGHDKSSFDEPDFLKHLLGGIEWAAGAVEGDCSATQKNMFQRTPLVNSDLKDPMELAVAPDRRVFYIERTGAVKVIDQKTTAVTTLRDFKYTPEQTSQSDGLLGLVLDNDFAKNKWLYLLWSDKKDNQLNLSRFTVKDNSLADEKRLLTIPTLRGEGRANSHMGGGLAMDKAGNLYAGIGDNTDPWASSGYTPIDERKGRRAFDAQTTAGNTNDLRGKILRITPQPDGTAKIPPGNLYPLEEQAKTQAEKEQAKKVKGKVRHEIYAMGVRNPFRISVDPHTNDLLVGDYGPDASKDDPKRGPAGLVEFNRIPSAGNYGWPYCVADNIAYNDYDFDKKVSGDKFNCDKPVNNSPNNTGLNELYPARKADVWYGDGAHGNKFPELGGGGEEGPMSGPVYDFDPNNPSKVKFPEYFDRKWFVYEYTREWFKTLSLHQTAQKFTDSNFGETKKGDLQSINGIFSGMSWKGLIEAEFGPDGSMYVIDFGGGKGSGRGGSNEDSGIYRIDYVADGRLPVSKGSVDRHNGPAPLTVKFSSAGSTSGEGVSYKWDFDGDGHTDSEDANPTHTYKTKGRFHANLTVTDKKGLTSVIGMPITAGNTEPKVEFEALPVGGFADFGDRIAYKVKVTDAEDKEIDCSRVIVQTLLGHNDHKHPFDPYHGCSGTVTTSADADGHGPGQNLYSVINAEYTDSGGSDPALRLTGSTQVALKNKFQEAEFATGSGTQVVPRPNASGGKRVGDIDNGDWLKFDQVNLLNIGYVTVGAASGSTGGEVEFRADKPDGDLLGKATIPATGGWDNIVSPTVGLKDPGRTFDLYLVFKGDPKNKLMALDWLRFNGKGLKEPTGVQLSGSATPTTGPAPLEVTFTGVATPPSGRKIQDHVQVWDFGDNTPVVHSLSTKHRYTHPGTYTARLTVTDDTGAVGSVTYDVTVT